MLIKKCLIYNHWRTQPFPPATRQELLPPPRTQLPKLKRIRINKRTKHIFVRAQKKKTEEEQETAENSPVQHNAG